MGQLHKLMTPLQRRALVASSLPTSIEPEAPRLVLRTGIVLRHTLTDVTLIRLINLDARIPVAHNHVEYYT